jgi:hypothetical protein
MLQSFLWQHARNIEIYLGENPIETPKWIGMVKLFLFYLLKCMIAKCIAVYYLLSHTHMYSMKEMIQEFSLYVF